MIRMNDLPLETPKLVVNIMKRLAKWQSELSTDDENAYLLLDTVASEIMEVVDEYEYM